jgi:hypothetical protein
VSLELTPLDKVSPAVEKVTGAGAPAPLKMMTARGMAPLSPSDLLTALYQLAQVGEEAVKAAAYKTAAELPDLILSGALSQALDARVLDFFARRVVARAKVLDVVLLNKATSDETFVDLTRLAGEAELEVIAKNEERLLRTPAIICGLYMNPKTRMSTAQRALELAVRNGVRVDGIPAFEEVAKAIGHIAPEETARDDDAFRRATEVAVDPAAQLQVVAVDEKEAAALAQAEAEKAEAEVLGQGTPETQAEVEEKKKKLTDLSVAGKIRVATLGNAFARAVLIRDTNKQVSMACIRSPAVSDGEVLTYAGNRSLDDDIIRYISNQRQWVRLYGVKVALCYNPKCPMSTTMRLLPHLNVRDLKGIARSKGIPSAVATAAKNMLTQRNA